MQISVSRKAHFNAAHRLHVSHWSDEKNKAFFGACNNANFHGHNYNLTVTVTGMIDEETGYLFDMNELRRIIREEVEDRFDHKNLNLDCVEFESLNPTCENVAVIIWRLIKQRLPQDLLLKVKLFETERNYVEYTGN